MDSKKQPGRKRISDTLKKKQVGLRLAPKDLFALQQMAEKDSIPYQTLIGSIIHKYIEGRLIEKKEDIKIPRQREEINHKQCSQRAN